MADSPETRILTPRVRTVGGVHLDVVESCLYLWLFDSSRGRYRRVPRGTRVEYLNGAEGWETYDRYEVDADAGNFVVLLNREGTRRLSARWHNEDCPCLDEATRKHVIESAG